MASKVDFTSGTGPYSVAIGDLDGDGKPDVAAANATSNTVSIFRNTSTSGTITTGSYAAKVDITTGTSPRSVAIGDVDGDGKPDLAVANVTSNTISVFRNTGSSGTISFATKVDFTAGTGPFGVAIGDIDSDGKLDIAAANQTSATLSVFRNTSTSGTIDTNSFATKVDFTTGSGPVSVAIGDVDGDGKPDVAVANQTSTTMSVLRNTSTSGTIDTNSFATKVDFATGTNPFSVAVGDLDGNGKLDVAVTSYGSNTVSIYHNTSTSGTISLGTKVDFTTGSTPRSVAIGDLDGDAKPDLAVANQASNTMSIFLNTSTSGTIDANSFASKVDFTTGTTPWSAAIGDLDGDGKPDLSIANNGGNNVSIFHNLTLTTALPTITSFTPTSGNVGATVTITGTNFDTTPANNTVFFGATKATVTAATATQLTVTVPSGATFAPISVTVANRTAISDAFFLPRFTSPAGGISNSTLASRVDFSTGTQPRGVAIGDVDGDGKPDLAAVNFGSNTVSVFRNTSTTGTVTASSFASGLTFATAASPFDVIISDIDGDGKPDLSVVNNTGTSISVLHNTSTSGTISLAAKVDFTVDINPRYVALNDIDSDGKPDLVISNTPSNSVSVLRNTSTSGTINTNSFATKVDFTTGSMPTGVVIGDIDGDGKPDLAAANNTGNSVSVLRSTSTSGTVSFATKVDLTTATGPWGLTIGDADGDGKLDLATANYGGGTGTTTSLLRNTSTSGTVSFAAKVDLTTGTAPINIAFGGIDGDGKPDLITTNFSSNTVSTLRNTSTSGTVSFASKVDFTTGSDVYDVALGDLDSDGKPELTATNYSSNTLSIFHNLTSLLVSQAPQRHDTNSGRTSNVTATFSQALAVGTSSNFVVHGSFTGKRAGAYGGGGSTTLTFDPTTDFKSGEKTYVTFTPSLGASKHVYTYKSKAEPAPAIFNEIVGTFGTGSDATYALAFFDADGDGDLDIATGNTGQQNVIYVNDGNSGFASTNNFGSSTTATWALDFADMDGDGDLDIIMGSSGGQNTVCLNVSQNFNNPRNFGTGSDNTYAVAAADVDGDNDLDIAVGNLSEQNTIAINVQLPKITSFTPTSGNVGATVTITGTNFSTTPANNTVFFGTIKATVSAATATQLTLTVPTHAPFAPISVTVANRTAISDTPFLPTFTATVSGIDANTLAGKVDLTAGSNPLTMAVGDIDGDGKPDLIATNQTAATVSVFRNTSTSGTLTTGSFATKVDFATGASPYSAAVGDIDGDGKPEVIVVNSGATSFSIFRNTSTSGTVSLAAKVDFTTGGQPYYAALNDFDGDGKLDVAVNSSSSGVVSVFRNTSVSGTIDANSFAAKVDFTASTQAYNVSAGDIDGDGKPDLAVTNLGADNVSIFRNTSTPGTISSSSFATKVDFTTGAEPRQIGLVDLDGDGKRDLAIANFNSNTVSTFLNTSTSGTVSFAAKVDFTGSTGPYGVGIGDIDGDGKPDVATSNASTTTISLFRNTSTSGTISLASKVDFTAGSAPYAAIVSDLDGDGKPDIAASNNTSSTISIFHNQIFTGTIPTLTSFTPTSGNVGATVTITGTNFSTTPANNTVFFGATKATVSAATATQLTVDVPSGATFAPIRVTVTNRTAVSDAYFLPRFTSPSGGVSSTSFDSRIDFTTGTGPVEIV